MESSVCIIFKGNGFQTNLYNLACVPNVGDVVRYWTNLKDEGGIDETLEFGRLKEKECGIVKSREFDYESTYAKEYKNMHQTIFVTLNIEPIPPPPEKP